MKKSLIRNNLRGFDARTPEYNGCERPEILERLRYLLGTEQYRLFLHNTPRANWEEFAAEILGQYSAQAFLYNVTFLDYALAAHGCGCFSCAGALDNLDRAAESLALASETEKPYIRANVKHFRRMLVEIVASDTVKHSEGN